MSQGETSPRRRQLVDWSAAIWAGLIGGTAFLVVNFLLTPVLYGGNAWVSIRLLASIVIVTGERTSSNPMSWGSSSCPTPATTPAP